MRAVMESPEAAKSFLQPGSYKTFADNNKAINKAKVEAGERDLKEVNGKFIEDVNPMYPSVWVQIASQMLTGKALIGVSANANAAHAIFQHAKGALDLLYPFKFDGIEYRDLKTKKTKSGKLVTKNIAETLAAFVDNGKDPQAKYSNINSYTIDVAMAMALSGIDLDVIQFFLSQPVIENFVNDYRNLGGDAKALNKVKSFYAGMLKLDSKAQLSPSKVVAKNFDIKDLKEKVADYSDNAWNFDILSSFLKYKEISRSVSNLTTAVKIGEAGLGPSDSDNLSRLDTLKSDNFPDISGATQLLEDSDLFPYHFVEVIKNGRELILGGYIENEDGEKERDKFYLPDRDKGAFAELRERFRGLKGTSSLTTKEIEFINKNYLDYLASHIKFFNFNKEFVESLPYKLSLAKKGTKYLNFLNRLNLDYDNANNLVYIVYTGISGQDKHVIDRIRDSWEAMFEDDTVLMDSSSRYYTGDIMPEDDTIFVFGSNPEGRHGAGAAKVAAIHFGARMGQGVGLHGNSYALPTKDLRVKENNGLRSISKETIVANIKALYRTASKLPSKKFKVAYRNVEEASLNGYTGIEMMEMFNEAGTIPGNIVFSKEWFDSGVLNLGDVNAPPYTVSNLAYDLVKYSFAMSGFRITPQSFSHLQPVSFYSDYIEGFNDTMESLILTAEGLSKDSGLEAYGYLVNNFFNQFIRNHFRSLSVVPKADIETKTNVASYKMKKGAPEVVLINKDQAEFITKDKEFVPYIKTSVKGNQYLLGLRSTTPDGKVGIYGRIEPLGTYKRRANGGLTSGKMFTQWDLSSYMPSESNLFEQNKLDATTINVDYDQNFPTEEPPSFTDDNPANDECNTKP